MRRFYQESWQGIPFTTFAHTHFFHLADAKFYSVFYEELFRRRTRVVGTFPDGNSALMLVCARLRHVAGTQWGNKKYMNMKHLEAAMEDVSIAG